MSIHRHENQYRRFLLYVQGFVIGFIIGLAAFDWAVDDVLKGIAPQRRQLVKEQLDKQLPWGSFMLGSFFVYLAHCGFRNQDSSDESSDEH